MHIKISRLDGFSRPHGRPRRTIYHCIVLIVKGLFDIVNVIIVFAVMG
jgi:hypothetical protein